MVLYGRSSPNFPVLYTPGHSQNNSFLTVRGFLPTGFVFFIN